MNPKRKTDAEKLQLVENAARIGGPLPCLAKMAASLRAKIAMDAFTARTFTREREQ